MNPISFQYIDRRWSAVVFGACMLVAGISDAQNARVASSSLEIRPLEGEKKIELSFRLVDDPAITLVSASTGELTAPADVPVVWKTFAGTPTGNCAWMVVIDNSNPARQETVKACIKEVRRFLKGLPSGDTVVICTLARDLVVVAPFESSSDELEAALDLVKAGGEGALATLIYQNLRQAISERLENRTESRKAVVLFTDGKDETPGGAEAIRGQINSLVERANKVKAAVYTMGFAEAASEANWFADLKELSFETEGLHFAAAVATRQLPVDTWPTITGVMHGGGVATLDVSEMATAAAVRVEIRTASGKRAQVEIAQEAVAQALAAIPPIPSPDPEAVPKPETNPEPKPETDPEPKPEPEPGLDAAAEKNEPGATYGWVLWSLIGAGVGLLALILVVVFRRRAAEEARQAKALRDAEQARFEQEKLEAEAIESEQSNPIEPPSLAQLEMCDGDQTRYPVALTNLRIGRGQHNDLVFRNDSISGNHCVIRRNRQGEWSITDLESGNGVIVNGERMPQSILRHGDVIELGDLKMRFLLN